MSVVDATSATVAIDADATWADAERAAQRAGLSLAHLVDTVPSVTLRETLEAPAWLPPLWPAHTARGALVSLRATYQPSPQAESLEYQHVAAPRTASGPDGRAFFLGAEGRVGRIEEVTLAALPDVPMVWLRAVDIDASRLHDVVNRFGSCVGIHGDAPGNVGGWVCGVRSGTRLADLCVARLMSAGFAEGPPPERGAAFDTVSLPWTHALDALASAPAASGACVVAGGPTHVALGIRRRLGADAKAWLADATAGVGPEGVFTTRGRANGGLALGDVVAGAEREERA